MWKRTRCVTRMRKSTCWGQRCKRVHLQVMYVRMRGQIHTGWRIQRCCDRRSVGAERLLPTAALKGGKSARRVERVRWTSREYDMAKSASYQENKRRYGYGRYHQGLFKWSWRRWWWGGWSYLGMRYVNMACATLETRRELEQKFVPQLFLGSLLGMGRSAIGECFFENPQIIITKTRFYEPARLSTPPKPLFPLKCLDAPPGWGHCYLKSSRLAAVLRNSPRIQCESYLGPVFISTLKWRM